MSDELLADAIETEDAASIARLLRDREFTLIQINDNADDQAGAALTAEVDDFAVLIVFLTEKAAGDFVADNADLAEEGETVDGLVINGKALFEFLPEDFGLLLNPESEDNQILEPELCALVKQLLGS